MINICIDKLSQSYVNCINSLFAFSKLECYFIILFNLILKTRYMYEILVV